MRVRECYLFEHDIVSTLGVENHLIMAISDYHGHALACAVKWELGQLSIALLISFIVNCKCGIV